MHNDVYIFLGTRGVRKGEKNRKIERERIYVKGRWPRYFYIYLYEGDV